MFYETLAQYYDQVFPPAPDKISFLDDEFSRVPAKRVLDLACGTGTYTIALAEKGYEAWGTDLEEKMIALARQKVKNSRIPVHFSVGDMQRPDLLGITFHSLFCIGNSLAHLRSENAVLQTLKAMHHVLQPGGAVVLQIVNFDRILAQGDTPLPLIENEKLRFIRIYKPKSSESLEFVSRLELKQPGGSVKSLHNSITLRPILQNDLLQYLKAAGFDGIETYGDFRRSEYSKESPATVITAQV